jgi:hypothetical protein
VVILLVEMSAGARHEHTWVVLPIQAQAQLQVETKPFATVKVVIGNKTYGPAVASKTGHVTVPAVVPPGIPTATVNATDRAGNTTTKPLELPAHDYPRVATLPEHPSASWSDGAPLPVYVFAIHPDGTVQRDPKALTLKAEHGRFGEPRVLDNGELLAFYYAPEVVGAGAERIFAKVQGSAVEVSVPLKVRPGPEAGLRVELAPNEYHAGSSSVVEVRSEAVDIHGNLLGAVAESQVTSDFGTVVREGERFELRVPDAFNGRAVSNVRAESRGLKGEGALPLMPGTAALAHLRLANSFPHAGRTVQASLALRDSFQNPVPNAQVAVQASTGGEGQVTERARGKYQVDFAVPRDGKGEVRLVASTQEGVVGQADMTVLPYERAWGVSPGVLLGTEGNRQFWASAARVFLALRLGQTEAELLGEAQWSWAFVDFQASASQTDATNQVVTSLVTVSKLHTTTGALGLRYTFPLSQKLAVQATAALGGGGASSHATTSSGTFVARAGGGISVYLGPGRLLAQVEARAETLSAGRALAQGTTELAGNLSGVGFFAGYLLRL